MGLTTASACLTATTSVVIVPNTASEWCLCKTIRMVLPDLTVFGHRLPILLLSYSVITPAAYDLPLCTSKPVSCSVMCTFTLIHIYYIIISSYSYHHTHMYNIVRIHHQSAITTHTLITSARSSLNVYTI